MSKNATPLTKVAAALGDQTSNSLTVNIMPYHSLSWPSFVQMMFICITVTLKHVAKTVAHVELSDHVVNVVFTLFDDNSKYTEVMVFRISRRPC